MERERLYYIVDQILNHSSEADIEVILEAVRRRSGTRNKGTFRGINPEKLAKETASMLNSQISYSIGNIRSMIQDFAVDIIKKEAPELRDEQIQELLDAWVPDPSQKKSGSGNSPDLPKDVLLTMVRQLLSFSAGTMSATEQTELYNQIPDWQREYWRRLPDEVRDIVTLFLKGKIDEEACWDQIYSIFDSD